MSGRDRVTVVGTDTGGGVVIVGILAVAAIFLSSCFPFSLTASIPIDPGPSTLAQSFLRSKPRLSRSCKVISLWATASSCAGRLDRVSHRRLPERLEGREEPPTETSHRISGQQIDPNPFGPAMR